MFVLLLRACLFVFLFGFLFCRFFFTIFILFYTLAAFFCVQRSIRFSVKFMSLVLCANVYKCSVYFMWMRKFYSSLFLFERTPIERNKTFSFIVFIHMYSNCILTFRYILLVNIAVSYLYVVKHSELEFIVYLIVWQDISLFVSTIFTNIAAIISLRTIQYPISFWSVQSSHSS